jgi:hypothetical protein
LLVHLSHETLVLEACFLLTEEEPQVLQEHDNEEAEHHPPPTGLKGQAEEAQEVQQAEEARIYTNFLKLTT